VVTFGKFFKRLPMPGIMFDFAKSIMAHSNPRIVRRAFKDVKLLTLGAFTYIYVAQQWSIYCQNERGVINPTSMHLELTTYCPKRCADCYISVEDRREKSVIDLDTAHKAVAKAKSLGIRIVNFIGGEAMNNETLPIMSALAEKHWDTSFYSCTNGELIASKPEYLDGLVRRHNFSTGLSIDGFQQTNDALRTKGSFKNVVNAAAYLHSRRCFFGLVSTIHAANREEVLSTDFVNFAADTGASFLVYGVADSVDNIAEVSAALMRQNDSPIFIYTNLFGYIDGSASNQKHRIFYVNKEGVVLNDRRAREFVATLENAQHITGNAAWLRRYQPAEGAK
jgi:sulfatase maturation enzyme AslB (radical SAM superfamily)